MGYDDDRLEKVCVFNGLTGEFMGTFGSIEKVSLISSAGRKEGATGMATQLMKFDYKKLEKLVKYYNELNGRKPYIICNNKTAEMFANDIVVDDVIAFRIALDDLVVFGARVLVDTRLKDYEVEVR